jgi:hypothetical protein
MNKKEKMKNNETMEELNSNNPAPKISDLNWTDYVLSLLSDDEKIAGNPTTDGLRRIFEIALNCRLISSTSNVAQSPDPNNEKRATVVHSLTYILNNDHTSQHSNDLNIVSVDGAADVYWGNCDKVYRNHPVAVAETRAEGRALRRALRLRKVVAAEEIAKDIDDHPDQNSVNKISNQQINFIDVLAQRLNINVNKLLEKHNIKNDNIYALTHESAVDIIRMLSKYQQNISEISENIMGYSNEWK